MRLNPNGTTTTWHTGLELEDDPGHDLDVIADLPRDDAEEGGLGLTITAPPEGDDDDEVKDSPFETGIEVARRRRDDGE